MRKLWIKAPKLPVLQLFMAKFLQIKAVDSSSNLASELKNRDKDKDIFLFLQSFSNIEMQLLHS